MKHISIDLLATKWANTMYNYKLTRSNTDFGGKIMTNWE